MVPLGHVQHNRRGTSYLICGLDPPFFPYEHVCADELPAFSDMQLVEQFSWAGRKYLIYERREVKDNKEDLTRLVVRCMALNRCEY